MNKESRGHRFRAKFCDYLFFILFKLDSPNNPSRISVAEGSWGSGREPQLHLAEAAEECAQPSNVI